MPQERGGDLGKVMIDSNTRRRGMINKCLVKLLHFSTGKKVAIGVWSSWGK